MLEFIPQGHDLDCSSKENFRAFHRMVERISVAINQLERTFLVAEPWNDLASAILFVE